MTKSRKPSNKQLIAGVCALAVVLTLVAGALGRKPSADFATTNDFKSYTTEQTSAPSINGSNMTSYSESGALKETGDTEASKASPIKFSQIIIRNASLSLEVTDYDNALSLMTKKSDELGGYIASSEEYDYDNNKSGNLVINIPAEKLDAFLLYLEKINGSSITAKRITSTDITSDYVDTQSRINSLETELDTLLSLMSKAGSLSDTISIQDRITQVRADLEYYKSMLARMDSQISYSAVSITMTEVDRTTTKGTGFWFEIKEGLKNSLFSIGRGFKEMTIWFVTSLPFIVIIFICVIIAVKIIKFGVRKWKTKKSSTSTCEETNQP